MNKYSLSIFTIILASRLFAADITLNTSVDKQTATVGDVINYTLTLTYPKAYKLDIPAKTDELGQFSVEDLKNAQKEDKGNIIQDVMFSLTAFTTGTLTIPEIILKYTDDKGQANEVKAPPLKIQIESVVAKYGNAGDIRDIKPPLALRTPFLLILLRLLLLAAAAFAAYYWYRSYREKRAAQAPVEPETPPVPPYQTALDELEKLRNSGLIGEGRIKEFYIALSDIIRNYLSAEHRVDTLDKTTAEIYDSLKRLDINMKYLMDVRALFEECDLVKFAKYRPDEKICLADLENAVQLVKK